MKSINSFAPCCESYCLLRSRRHANLVVRLWTCLWSRACPVQTADLFLFPSDRGSNITLLELTNQVALLKLLSYGVKIKNRFQKIIIGRDPCMGIVLSWYQTILVDENCILILNTVMVIHLYNANSIYKCSNALLNRCIFMANGLPLACSLLRSRYLASHATLSSQNVAWRAWRDYPSC